MKIDKLVILQGIEGHPDEIRAALADHLGDGVMMNGAAAPLATADPDAERLAEVLTRRPPLKPNARKWLAVQYAAGEKSLTSTEIAAKLGLANKEAFNGVLSGFTKRIANTLIVPPGKHPLDMFCRIKRPEKGEQDWQYTLLPAARQAIELAGIIR